LAHAIRHIPRAGAPRTTVASSPAEVIPPTSPLVSSTEFRELAACTVAAALCCIAELAQADYDPSKEYTETPAVAALSDPEAPLAT
jgi:hypothetical protein